MRDGCCNMCMLHKAVPSLVCADIIGDCRQFEAQGYCGVSIRYHKDVGITTCCVTCRHPVPEWECINYVDDCEVCASQGQCFLDSFCVWMSYFCCVTCRDQSTDFEE